VDRGTRCPSLLTPAKAKEEGRITGIPARCTPRGDAPLSSKSVFRGPPIGQGEGPLAGFSPFLTPRPISGQTGRIVIDCHVHLQPERLAVAIRRFFESHMSSDLVYSLDRIETLDRLHRAGINIVWNLPYAHKPGVADSLNEGMAAITNSHATHSVALVTGCTVHASDPKPGDLIRKAAESHGARVCKLHVSVGGYSITDPLLHDVWETAAAMEMPVVVHVGNAVSGLTEPGELDDLGQVAGRHPGTRIIAAHGGHPVCERLWPMMDELANLYADLTPVISEPVRVPVQLLEAHPDRFLFGSDAPNTELTVERQIQWLRGLGLTQPTLTRIEMQNALELVPIDGFGPSSPYESTQ
jgi:uncharacterized protein